MLLERTLTTLQTRVETPDRAMELGRLGYLQWMMFLSPGDSYRSEATRALAMAAPFEGSDPAVAVFARLIRESLSKPGQPIEVPLPAPKRRGGARARRVML